MLLALLLAAQPIEPAVSAYDQRLAAGKVDTLIWIECVRRAAVRLAPQRSEPASAVAEAAMGLCIEQEGAALSTYDFIYQGIADGDDLAREAKAGSRDRLRRSIMGAVMTIRSKTARSR